MPVDHRLFASLLLSNTSNWSPALKVRPGLLFGPRRL